MLDYVYQIEYTNNSAYLNIEMTLYIYRINSNQLNLSYEEVPQWKELFNLKNAKEVVNMVFVKEWEQKVAERLSLVEDQEAERN